MPAWPASRSRPADDHAGDDRLRDRVAAEAIEAVHVPHTSATASDPIDAAVSINVTGTADGTITNVVTNTYIVDLGSESLGGGNVVAVGITPPSP